MEIKVSVIIPAYNVEDRIERTLKSAIEQTLKEIEILVIDDGSSDETEAIVKRIASREDKVKLFAKKNGGVSSARNYGIEKALGEYLYFLDGDDWIEKNTLEDMYEFSWKNNLEICIADYYVDYDNGNLEYVSDSQWKEKVFTGREYVNEFLNGKTMRGICCRLIKRGLFIENNILFPLGIRIGEDVITILRLGFLSEKIGKIDKPYLHYIKNPNSVTNLNKAHIINEYFGIYDILDKFLLEKGIKEEYEKLVYRHKIFDFKDFMFQDSDWNNEEYLQAADKFLDIVRDKRIRENLDLLDKKQKIFWIPVLIFKNRASLRLTSEIIKILIKISNHIKKRCR